MANLKTCTDHWDKMHEITTFFHLLPEEQKEAKRAEARKHFEDHIECMNKLGIKVQKEFNPRFLLPLLYPEQAALYNTAAMNLTLGSGAGEEEPPAGGRRSRRKSRRSKKTRRTKRRA